MVANTTSQATGLAVLGSGERVAFWDDGSNVSGQRFDASGHLIGGALLLAAQARLTGVAALASGGSVVAYQRADAVYVQIVTPGGTPAGAPIVVRTQAQITADYPSDPHEPSEAATLAGGSGVIAFPDGSFAALYLKYQPSHIPGTIPYEQFGQKYDATGRPLGAPADLGSEGLPAWVSTAPVAGDGLLVAHVLACPCSGAGAPGTRLFDANLQFAHVSYGGMPGNNTSPSAAAIGGGNFVMVWTAQPSTSGGASQVQGQIFTADPSTVTGSRNVTPVITFQNAAAGARVLALAGGGFLLAWRGGAQAFDAVGQAVSPVMQILDGSVAATPDGGFLVLAQVGAQLVEQSYTIPR